MYLWPPFIGFDWVLELDSDLIHFSAWRCKGGTPGDILNLKLRFSPINQRGRGGETGRRKGLKIPR